jgi:hypothetical protein
MNVTAEPATIAVSQLNLGPFLRVFGVKSWGFHICQSPLKVMPRVRVCVPDGRGLWRSLTPAGTITPRPSGRSRSGGLLDRVPPQEFYVSAQSGPAHYHRVVDELLFVPGCYRRKDVEEFRRAEHGCRLVDLFVAHFDRSKPFEYMNQVVGLPLRPVEVRAGVIVESLKAPFPVLFRAAHFSKFARKLYGEGVALDGGGELLDVIAVGHTLLLRGCRASRRDRDREIAIETIAYGKEIVQNNAAIASDHFPKGQFCYFDLFGNVFLLYALFDPLGLKGFAVEFEFSSSGVFHICQRGLLIH